MKIITLICLLLFLFYDSNGQNIEMIQVEGGTFSREGVDITISSFKIGKYEVTQEQYNRIMGGLAPGYYYSYGEGPVYPVYNVSYFEALAFCNLLTKKTPGMGEVQQCYYSDADHKYPWTKEDAAAANDNTLVYWDHTKSGYRLPTEAEWEYAARGGNQSKNYQYSGSNTIGDVAWYSDNNTNSGYDNGTKPVGKKNANELGIHDMSGNVQEWCFDYLSGYSEAAQCNPVREVKDQVVYRVLRGGAWYYYAEICRVAFRGYSGPLYHNINIGFRLVSQ